MRAFALCGFFLIATVSFAQKTKADTVIIITDTATLSSQRVEKIESYASRFDPRKALLFSAIMPGAGQLYNKKLEDAVGVWRLYRYYHGSCVL